MILGLWEVEREGDERGCETVRVCVCVRVRVCACVWMQGRGRDSEICNTLLN